MNLHVSPEWLQSLEDGEPNEPQANTWINKATEWRRFEDIRLLTQLAVDVADAAIIYFEKRDGESEWLSELDILQEKARRYKEQWDKINERENG